MNRVTLLDNLLDEAASSNLITKYRPKTFKEVIGQDVAVRAIQAICKRKDAQIFLLSGPAGTGKTTLARLIAKAYGVEDNSHSILEVNGATATGIDSMRQIQDMLQYRPFSGSGKRAVIIDEAHRCSPQAHDSLLKVLEEPPAHIVWCFCTTNPAKIPITIKSRCAKFELKAVPENKLGELYDYVCEQEQFDIPGDVGDLIIREANGSPRQLLSNIVACRVARDKREAAQLLSRSVQSDASLELCRFLMQANGSWVKCMGLLKSLEEDSSEGTRILIANYFAACLRNAKTDDEACRFMGKLESFSQSYVGGDDKAQLLLSIGRVLFSE